MTVTVRSLRGAPHQAASQLQYIGERLWKVDATQLHCTAWHKTKLSLLSKAKLFQEVFLCLSADPIPSPSWNPVTNLFSFFTLVLHLGVFTVHSDLINHQDLNHTHIWNGSSSPEQPHQNLNPITAVAQVLTSWLPRKACNFNITHLSKLSNKQPLTCSLPVVPVIKVPFWPLWLSSSLTLFKINILKLIVH